MKTSFKYDKSLEPCPICGATAYISHDSVDGFDFGWSAGCPRFCLEDGIHGITEDTPEYKWPRAEHWSKEGCIQLWNEKARDLKNGH